MAKSITSYFNKLHTRPLREIIYLALLYWFFDLVIW